MKTMSATYPTGLATQAGRIGHAFRATRMNPDDEPTARDAGPRPENSGLLERVMRMRNAEMALHLLFGAHAVPLSLSAAQALRRYLAGENLPPDLAAQCQRYLDDARRGEA